MLGDVWFVERRSAHRRISSSSTCAAGLKGADSLLVDPEALETQHRQTARDELVTRRHLMARWSPTACRSRAPRLRCCTCSTCTRGRAVGAPIARADFGGVDWSPDGTHRRVQPPAGDEARAWRAPTSISNSQALLMARASRIERARGLRQRRQGVEDRRRPRCPSSASRTTAVGRSATRSTARSASSRLFVASQSRCAGRQAGLAAASFAASRRGDRHAAYMDDRLYLLSHKGAPRSQVLALDLKSPDLATATVVVPASERVVANMVTAADALYVEARDGNVKRLYKRGPTAGGAAVGSEAAGRRLASSSAKSEGGAIAADSRLPGVVVDAARLERARRRSTWWPPTARVSNTGLQPAGPYDAPRRHRGRPRCKVKSHDGAMVPLSIIHRKGSRARRQQPDAALRLRQLRHHRRALLQHQPPGLARRRRRASPSPTRAAAACTARSGTAPATRPPSPTPGRTSSPAPST